MTEPDPTRRGVLATAATVVLGAVPIVGGLVAALRTALAPAKTEKPQRIPLCRLDEVPAEGILERALSYRLRRGPVVETVAQVVFVTREGADQEVIAMSGECTHLSCPVRLNDEPGGPPLACPCHGGKFSATGEVLDGPPPSPLRRFTIELPEDGKGMIHVVTE